MWVYFEEIDGELQPKWLIVKAITDVKCPYYTVNGPFERMLEEDMLDFHAFTVPLGDMIRDPFKENSIGVPVYKFKADLESKGIDPNLFNDIDYFIMLVDDVQELIEVNISRQLS
ncbi:hypothetical protein [Salipaludibacillus sp. CF4.18]|uniref:hypothetical protein n=1 Tax=Salipaludibacillus sp. CF4.18 TaxID=3373081 RepID=UPI003EE563F0